MWPPHKTPLRRSECMRTVSRNLYIGGTLSIYMSQKPIIEVTANWTHIGDGVWMRVKPAPVRVVPLSELNCTSDRPTPSGWVSCGRGAL